jgi:hypothetical protein
MKPCGVWKTTGIPAGKVDEVVAGYRLELDDPTKIKKTENPDGTIDVVATFPPCANGSPSNQPPD